MTYKEIAIRLSAIFSAETLQSRRKWQNMLKLKRGKIFIKGILLRKDLIQILWRNQKLYIQIDKN